VQRASTSAEHRAALERLNAAMNAQPRCH
jgi:hypothetical protein